MVLAENSPADYSKDVEEKVLELTQKCWNLREKNPDSAIMLGLKGLELANEYKILDAQAKLTGYLGVVYFHYKYDMKSAIPYLQESLRKSMLVGDSIRMAYSYNNLGDVYMYSGNIALAINYSKQSIRIFEILKNKKGIAYGYVNLGLIYQEERRYDKSQLYLNKALKLRNDIGDKGGYASALYQLGKSQQFQGKYDSALNNYKKSYEFHKNIENVSYTANCLNGIATIYYLRGEFDRSLENFNQAIELHSKKNHNFGLVEDYLGIAMVYGAIGNTEKAKSSLNKALSLSTKLELHPKVLQSYKAFAKFYQSINNKDAALDALNKFVVLYDSVLFVQQIEVLEEITSNYETQQKLQIAKKELELKKTERYYMLTIIILMIIIVFVAIWRVRYQTRLNKQLKEANATKDKLFSVISHDLRSPFNTILGFSDILKRTLGEENKDAVQYSGIIYDQSLETVRLIDRLLTWSRSQSNKIVFNPKPSYLETVFKELKDAFEYLVDKNELNLEFENQVHENVNIDKNIVNILLTNLISNSIKFTHEGGKIIVSAEIHKNKLQLKVKDSGIGIDEVKITNLLNNQTLESSKGVRNEGGTGLGLNICMELTHLHNGIFDIKSQAGEGTEIIILLSLG